MLILCNFCSSKYLINSADLKPFGRTVQCSNCNNQWYQENSSTEEKDILGKSIPDKNLIKKVPELPISNLPSTYVKESKVSFINSFLMILLMSFFIIGFFIYKNMELNNLILFKFYLDEFYFNLRLIVNDMAKVVHKIINF